MTQLKREMPVRAEDYFPFSCRGCGELCCRNLATTIHATTPEYIRILWYLQRHPEAARYLRPQEQFVLDRSYFTGLPVMKLVTEMPKNACPLAYQSDESGMDPNQVLCAIHKARPSDCRLFPLIMTNTGSFGGVPVTTEYFITNFCPGFDIPLPNEKAYAGYAPPPPEQTVKSWVDDQLDAQFFEEILYNIFELVSYYNYHGWYLLTADQPDGKLDDPAYDRLARIFFEVPPAPAQPADDHSIIMERMKYLRDNMETIIHEVIA